MTTFTDEQKTEHAKASLQANLDAAWLRRVGPSGDPGEWCSIEMLEIDRDIDLDLFPAMVMRKDESGEYKEAFDGWRWYFKFYVDEDEEPTGLERSLMALDYEHGCEEGRGYSFIFESTDSKSKPEIPDVVVQAALLIREA